MHFTLDIKGGTTRLWRYLVVIDESRLHHTSYDAPIDILLAEIAVILACDEGPLRAIQTGRHLSARNALSTPRATGVPGWISSTGMNTALPPRGPLLRISDHVRMVGLVHGDDIQTFDVKTLRAAPDWNTSVHAAPIDRTTLTEPGSNLAAPSRLAADFFSLLLGVFDAGFAESENELPQAWLSEGEAGLLAAIFHSLSAGWDPDTDTATETLWQNAILRSDRAWSPELILKGVNWSDAIAAADQDYLAVGRRLLSVLGSPSSPHTARLRNVLRLYRADKDPLPTPEAIAEACGGDRTSRHEVLDVIERASAIDTFIREERQTCARF